MSARPINLKSLKEQVYDYLREQLQKGSLQPGSFVNLNEISAGLGVSRTPIRDALLQLEMEGFVTILPRRAIVVNVLKLDDIREDYEIIGALEAQAVAAAFELLTDSDFKTMQDLIEEMKSAVDRDDFDFYYKKNLAFHDIYLSRCGNERLVHLVTNLKRRLYDFPRQSRFIKEWEQASIVEHIRFLDFLREGRKDEAVSFVRNVHWSFEVQEKFIRIYYPESVPARSPKTGVKK